MAFIPIFSRESQSSISTKGPMEIMWSNPFSEWAQRGRYILINNPVSSGTVSKHSILNVSSELRMYID